MDALSLSTSPLLDTSISAAVNDLDRAFDALNVMDIHIVAFVDSSFSKGLSSGFISHSPSVLLFWACLVYFVISVIIVTFSHLLSSVGFVWTLCMFFW